jgi:hypothetical protein
MWKPSMHIMRWAQKNLPSSPKKKVWVLMYMHNCAKTTGSPKESASWCKHHHRWRHRIPGATEKDWW